MSYNLVCSLQPSGHLLGKVLPLGFLVYDAFCVFVTFLYGALGQVGHLTVWIPELCPLYYLHRAYSADQMQCTCNNIP